jgi:nucleoside-diphosphate-sugar epimerase
MTFYNKIRTEDLKQITSVDLPWEKFNNKTVLITGANGFIASYIVDTLVYLNKKKDYKINILALVRNEKKAIKRFGKDLVKNRVNLIVQDVCNTIKYKKKIDFIFHAASQATPDFYGSDPVGTLKANILGTNNLLDLAIKDNSESFLFVSSGEVYGEVKPDSFPTNENGYGYIDPLSVRSCYSESKRMAENMCVSWHHQYGVHAKIVRPFHTYGPGLDLNDVRSQAEFVSNVVKGKDISLLSDGSAIRSFCYISDTISAFFTVMLKGEDGKAYNVSYDKGEISIRSLAFLISSIFPERDIKVIRPETKRSSKYLQSTINKTSPDINKIKKLGWEPKVSLEKGFKRTIEAYL